MLKKILDLNPLRFSSVLGSMIFIILSIITGVNLYAKVFFAFIGIICLDLSLGKLTRYYFRALYQVISTVVLVSFIATDIDYHIDNIMPIVFGLSMSVLTVYLLFSYNKDKVYNKWTRFTIGCTQSLVYTIITWFLSYSVLTTKNELTIFLVVSFIIVSLYNSGLCHKLWKKIQKQKGFEKNE